MKRLTYKHTLIACYIGYITQAIIVNFMPILFIIFKDEYGISLSKLGTLVLINFLTQFVTDIISTKYVDIIGFRKAAIPAHTLSAVGLILLGILPSIMSNTYLALIISVILFSIGGGMIEVIVSPIVENLPSDDNSAAMSLLHSFYSWGQLLVVLITTLILKIFGYGSWIIISLIWAIIPIINICLFAKVPVPQTFKGEKVALGKIVLQRKFIIGLILMFAAGASEQTMVQWASLFAQEGLGVSKVVGDLLGPCLFAVFMGIGRMWYGIKGEKINLSFALLISSILCVICYLVVVLAVIPFIALLFCAFTGFTVSLLWPGVLSYNASNFPNGGAAIFGVMAMFGDLGCSFGPWLAGFTSDNIQKTDFAISYIKNSALSLEQFGLKAGILVGIIFPIMMILGLISLKNKKS